MSFPAYCDYTDSGVDWLGEFPEHWSVTAIKHVCREITDGAHVSPETENGVHCFVSTKDVLDNAIDFDNCLRTSDASYEYLLKTGCKPFVGDVLFSKDGTIGRTAVVGEGREFVVASSLIIIRLLPDRLDSGFLHHLCQSTLVQNQVERFVRGAGLPRLSITNLTKVVGCFPPLDEQKAISSFLDVETSKIDGLVSEQRRLIELLKEKRQAVISHAVTKGLNPNAPMKPSGIQWLGDVPQHWEVMKLGRVTIDRCDGPFGSGLKSSHYADEGIRVVRLNNIRHNYFDDSDAAFIDPDHYNGELGGGHDVIAGDLLIAGLGDANNAVGRACVAPDGIEPAMVKADCFRYRLDTERVLTSFMSAQLTIGAPTDAGLMSTGTTRSRMPLSVTSSRKIAFPDLAEQGKIAEFIDELTEQFDSLVSEAERAIELLQERRTALISAAVTGKIDIRKYVSSASLATCEVK